MRSPSDMTQLAIDTLVGTGTERGLALAAEIDRGRTRQSSRMPTEAERDAESREHERDQTFMLEQLRPARPEEWAQWVGAYLRSGGSAQRIRHYSYPMTSARFYVASGDLTVRPLYGALACHIILPAGVTADGGETGHGDLYGYRENGVTYRGLHNQTVPYFVPVYTDTEVSLP